MIVAMATVAQSVRDFLATGPFAHIVTINPDGRPHVSMAWAGLDGDELVFATFFDQHKMDNLRRDPRIVVSFQAKEFQGEGLHPYVVIDGRARIIEGGALTVMDQLSEYYIGPGATYPMRNMPEGLTVRVSIDRIYGVGPWQKKH
jgi:PPOX class probable F420-dependent enzyme